LFIDGQKKRLLTEWWLEIVDSNLDDFLSKKWKVMGDKDLVQLVFKHTPMVSTSFRDCSCDRSFETVPHPSRSNIH